MSLPPFEHVVAEHGTRVLRVCRALLPLHDAEDAAADALLAALEAYPRLRPDSDVKAWLVTVAHRKALDVLRRHARHAVPMAEVADTSGRVGARQGGTLVGGLEPPDEQLWAAVRALPDKQRHAVVYHYVADLPYADVAALTGTSEAAARRSAADGIKALRRNYATRADPTRLEPDRSAHPEEKP